MPNIIVTGTPRSGTEAFCNLLTKQKYVDYNFNEYFNTIDLIYARDNNSGEFKNNYNKQFEHYTNKGDWNNAWKHLPKYDKETTHYLDWKKVNKTLEFTKKYSLIKSVNDFIEQYTIRWNNLQQIEKSWCIKILYYHYIPDDILNKIKNQTKNIVILFRKNKIDQAISMTISQLISQFHNINYKTQDETFFDYDLFEINLHSIQQEENWVLTNFKGRILYYEDIDFSKSNIKKNKINIPIDIIRCKNIHKNIFGWNWTKEI